MVKVVKFASLFCENSYLVVGLNMCFFPGIGNVWLINQYCWDGLQSPITNQIWTATCDLEGVCQREWVGCNFSCRVSRMYSQVSLSALCQCSMRRHISSAICCYQFSYQVMFAQCFGSTRKGGCESKPHTPGSPIIHLFPIVCWFKP